VADLSAELLERARRHGLERESDPLCQWFPAVPDEDREWRRSLVWQVREGEQRWCWLPTEYRETGATHSAPEYPAEEPALRAALDWLDTQHPERAHKPEPWGPVVEAVRVLRSIQAPVVVPTLRHQVREVIGLLERAVLGPIAPLTSEQALLALVDLRLDQGELGVQLRRRLRQVLQLHPDEAVILVDNLRIAGRWDRDQRYALQHAAETGETELVGHVWQVDEDAWRADVEGEELDNDDTNVFPTRGHALAAVDAALLARGYALAGGAVRVPEDQPATGPCQVCEGVGELGGCPSCGLVQEAPPYDPVPVRPCDYCRGTGRHDPLLASRCPRCAGTGTQP
jgi:hypothetical protein